MKAIIEYFYIKKKLLIITIILMSFLLGKAQILITGVVKDFNSKEPLIGATVLVKGTNSGTITDLDGKYSLNIPNNGTVLVHKLKEGVHGQWHLLFCTLNKKYSLCSGLKHPGSIFR